MALLELQHLKKYFATQKAVDDISFSIDRGNIFGLLGPNGAGKTTLIRMITGIFYPDSGNILFDGKNLDQWVQADDKSPAKWDIKGDILTVNKNYGNIETKQSFTNYQLPANSALRKKPVYTDQTGISKIKL